MQRLILAASFVCTAIAQPLSAQSLDAPTRARVDSVFARFDRTDSPGCALLAKRDGRTVYARGYGMASLELGVAITPQTVMDIGSTSKQFTAAAIWLLAQDGKLSLDDPVQKHLPELPRLAAPVTLRHILQHTSGWRDYTDLMALGGAQDEEVTTAADAITALGRQRAGNFAPGAEWSYSNTGFFLANQVVERVSGRSMRDFLRERIFAPLGMTHADLFDDHARMFAGRAPSYVPGASGWKVAASNWEQTGDGAVQASVEELGRWDANFDAPVPAVGGRALIDSLQRSGTLSDGTPISYAYGLSVDRYRGVKRVQHGGAWAGYRAMSMRFPDQRAAVYLTCNAGNANTQALAEGVADAMLARVLGPTDAERLRDSLALPTRAEFTSMAGVWFDATIGRTFTLVPDDSGATIGSPQGGPRRRLMRVGDGRFVATPVQPSPARLLWDAATASIVQVPEIGARVRFTRVRAATPLSQAQRGELVGSYTSAEVPGTWTVDAKGDTLRLTMPRRSAVVLQPTIADMYSADGLPIRVVRDARGRVSALSVTTRGVRDLRWVRAP